jgi:hypothetical protein
MQLNMRTNAFIMLSTSYITLLSLTEVAAQLNPACAPGGNFDLNIWQLEMPTPRPNQPSLPDVITSSRLVGCQGYQSNPYFYTDSKDGAMVMYVPGDPATTGCAKWAESDHCRTELGETSKETLWDPNGPHHRMSATLAVTSAGGGTAIGQVFHDDPLKPSAELYYLDDGTIQSK